MIGLALLTIVGILGGLALLLLASSGRLPPLLDEAGRPDLAERVDRLEIPIHLFIGEYDYTVNPELAHSFFMGLDAPRKGFHTFHESAHSPLFEEPERARRILLEEVLER